MNGQLVAKPAFSDIKPFVICFALIIGAWCAVFWQGLITAIDIWVISEIFNHCLLVLPGSAYLIYLKRHELDLTLAKPNYWVLVFCLGSLLLYAIGLAGDVQLFMHVATFTFLPFCIWAYIGNRLAYKILFPLFFILFCIPIGEEFIPTLQEITADMSVEMLRWTGIPIYRNGLYIEIPQGRFLVAEACSGISFFIASVVIGSLYSYLNISSVKRRVLFMSISILFPIIANAIRVFGIILTGHLTNMEHAVGADHLIYGWVFFAFVIICLLGIGELVREKVLPESGTDNIRDLSTCIDPKATYRSTSVIFLLMMLFLIWFKAINSQVNEPGDSPNLSQPFVSEVQEVESGRNAWQPEFIEPYQVQRQIVRLGGDAVDIYVAWYPKGQGELISSLNRLYTEKAWTLKSTKYARTVEGQDISIATIVNPRTKRLLTYWYVIDGEVFTDKKIAKLYEIYRIMMGTHVGSGLIALSQETENVSLEEDLSRFEQLVSEHMAQLNRYFNFE